MLYLCHVIVSVYVYVCVLLISPNQELLVLPNRSLTLWIAPILAESSSIQIVLYSLHVRNIVLI